MRDVRFVRGASGSWLLTTLESWMIGAWGGVGGLLGSGLMDL